MTDEAQTQPTLQTILERIEVVTKDVRELRAFTEDRFEDLETRMDKTQGAVLDTRATVREVRSDLKKLREQLNLPVS